ncbi:MAG TPA: HIT family protein [Candidatus Limnocylindria bacterium]|nr:HIT family protein [Candidatus Limnocylindria bacterium]
MPRTWPADWEQRYRGEGCLMCAQGRPDENEFGIRVYRSDTSDGYLQKADVGQRGYCLVIWRGRHVADVTQLSDTEAGSYWEDVLRVARAVELHYTPAKLNLMTLGNELPHLHTHVVPRYVDDSEPGRPPRFMRASIESPPLPDAAIRRDAAKLRELVDGQIAE